MGFNSAFKGLTSALDIGGWSTPSPGRFTPGKDPVPIVYEAGCVSGPAWAGGENLAHTGIRSRDRRVRSQSLNRLRCIRTGNSVLFNDACNR
jgi:hypothetical protein